MRIAIDARPLSAPWGGIRRYADCLLRALARVDVANDYALCGLPRGFSPEPALPARFTVCREPVPGVHWLEHAWLVSARGALDLYHGTNYAAPRFARCPVVITVHDLTVQLLPDTHPWRRRLRHRLLPALWRRAARVIADSRTTRDDLVRHCGVEPARVVVVPLAPAGSMRPVRDGAVLAAVRRRYGLPDRFLLYVGALEPRKDLPVLLEAFEALRREGREETLVLAGGGAADYVAALRAEVERRGLAAAVRMPGPVDERDLPALYAACLLFVYPSRYEGFGLPPLEAMACGAPVVVARTASLAEQFEGAAQTVEPGRPEALRAALAALLDDEAGRAALAARGRARASARDWDDVARDTLAVYREAVGEGAA
jgi:glycosyltransferase involved in cell wall biosynthesis